MKRANLQYTVLLAVLILVSCSNDDAFKGSGNIITESRELNDFTKVNNSTAINVSIIDGAAQSVELSADDNIINTIKTTVENGILKFELSKGNYIDVTIDVAVVMPDLDSLENSGSGTMTVSGFENLANLEIENGGSGNITLSGSGTLLSLENSGSGSYNGFGFTVDNCTVSNSGSGSCQINCTVTLSGSNSGSGNILYVGNPSVDVSNTGSGKVEDSN